MSGTQSKKNDKNGCVQESRKECYGSQVEALHAEMEIAKYGVNNFGQNRRKISREQSKIRTSKRKVLEAEDRIGASIETVEKKRIRGSKIAFEDEVLKGSLIFGRETETENIGGEEDDCDEDIEMTGYFEDNEQDDCDLSGEEDDERRFETCTDELDFEENEESGGEAVSELDSPNKRKLKNLSSSPSTQIDSQTSQSAVKRRTMYRMKNFKSYRLAQRHGAALKYFSIGSYRTAVKQLQGVASSVPVAPQVYSSLGLVYENMLMEEQRNNTPLENLTVEHSDEKVGEISEENQKERMVKKLKIRQEYAKQIHRRIELSLKAYASYHISALLCKMDYTLWVRAGDTALDISHLYVNCLNYPPILDVPERDYEVEQDISVDSVDNANSLRPNLDTKLNDIKSKPITTAEEYIKNLHVEKRKWMEAAKDSYLAADNLHPPGISIPAKLAFTHMELGNLSNALTILTDLKNNAQKIVSGRKRNVGKKSVALRRTELERSYTAWMLYADLMLLIGHHCLQWNRGIETNDNYMFRRWLRKYSVTFDWRERRLQALCMALEAAAGSKSCQNVIKWTRNRVKMKASESVNEVAEQSFWKIQDAYELDNDTDLKSLAQKDEKVQSDTAMDEVEIYDGENKAENGAVLEKKGESLTSNPTILYNQTGKEENRVTQKNTMFDSTLTEITARFRRERDLLLERHKSQMLEFDETTLSRNLISNSAAALKRAELRKATEEKHKIAVVELVGNFNKKKMELDESLRSETCCIEGVTPSQPLPLSASCTSVINIASQLLKLCLAMKLYDGARLGAEAVSCYLRERASRHEVRLKQVELFEKEKDENLPNAIRLNKETYDDLVESSDNSDSEDSSNIFLSDDEEFNSKSSVNNIEIMKTGVLPAELQVLYALSLIGEGESGFLAEKLLQALNELEDTVEEETDYLIGSGAVEDIPWLLFHRTMVNPMQKTAAFAFVGDLINNIGKEKEWANRLQALFEDQLKEIADGDNAEVLLNEVESGSVITATKRTNYLKILLATLRMRLCKAESIAIAASNFDNDYVSCKDDRSDNEALCIALSIFNSIIRFNGVLWDNGSDGDLNVTSIEFLRLVSGSFSILMNNINNLTQSMKNTILSQAKEVVSWICQVSIPYQDENNTTSSYQFTFTDSWQSFPVPSQWQSAVHSAISLRAYNLAIACSVSAFSGWEATEFTLKLLKNRKRGQNRFRVNVKGDLVTGILCSDTELEVSKQWKIVESLILNISSLDFLNVISKVKKADWYITAEKDMNEPTYLFGEKDALKILLLFSRLTLILAKDKEDRQNEDNIKYALSIILPLAQLGLGVKVWDSTLGTEATKEETDIYEWENFVTPPQSTATIKQPSRQRTTNRKKPKSVTEHVHERSEHAHERSLFSKLVKVPTAVLLREWTGKDYFNEERNINEHDRGLNMWSQECSGSAKYAMKKLDYAMRKLRKCCTIYSIQKSNIEVATALLEVSSKKECYNPFLCLHQAAVFASHGSKGGNNDGAFKNALPEENICTPNEALSILGRADCLRAIHFTNESMFLCSFVARVCTLRRQEKNHELSWTPKWRVIGIYMYTLSLAVDATIYSLTEGDERIDALDSWREDIRAEIDRARCDAIAVKRNFAKTSLAKSTQNVQCIVNKHTTDEKTEYDDEASWENTNYDDELSDEEDTIDDQEDIDEKYHYEENVATELGEIETIDMPENFAENINNRNLDLTEEINFDSILKVEV